MRAYGILLDRIYEVDGKVDDDQFIVIRGPYEAGLSGHIFGKFRWALIKDTAYLYLEREINSAIDRHNKYIETFEKDPIRALDVDFAKKEINSLESLLPSCRQMDPFFITKM